MRRTLIALAALLATPAGAQQPGTPGAFLPRPR